MWVRKDNIIFILVEVIAVYVDGWNLILKQQRNSASLKNTVGIVQEFIKGLSLHKSLDKKIEQLQYRTFSTMRGYSTILHCSQVCHSFEMRKKQIHPKANDASLRSCPPTIVFKACLTLSKQNQDMYWKALNIYTPAARFKWFYGKPIIHEAALRAICQTFW